jgi:hypothetical protein
MPGIRGKGVCAFSFVNPTSYTSTLDLPIRSRYVLVIRQRLSWVTDWSQKTVPCVDKLSANRSLRLKPRRISELVGNFGSS